MSEDAEGLASFDTRDVPPDDPRVHPLALTLGVSILLLGCAPTPATSAPTEPVTATPAAAPPAAGPAAVEPTAAAECPDAFATWPACASKPVRIRGANPESVLQHPMFDGPGLDGAREHQGYMDVPDVGQIVVLTREPIACPAAMVATGTLRRIEPTAKDPGVMSMESYGGWVLEGATVECVGGPP